MEKDELQKVTLNLRHGDVRRIREMYPKAGASAVIRQIVANYVDGLSPALSPDEIDELESTLYE